MSPTVHAELSWLTAQRLPTRRDRLLVVGAGLAPDLDGLTLLAGQDAYEAYHHVIFHGYVGAIITTVLCAAFAKQRLGVAALACVCFHLHLICDLAGSGLGWPIHYYWPTSDRVWWWSGGWELASWQNGVIALAVTLACFATAIPLRRTFFEVVSARLDVKVVEAIRRRVLRRRGVSVE